MRGRLARQEEERGGPGRRCGTASKGARCVLSPRPPGRHHLVQSPGAARPRPRGRPGLAGAERSLRGPGQVSRRALGCARRLSRPLTRASRAGRSRWGGWAGRASSGANPVHPPAVLQSGAPRAWVCGDPAGSEGERELRRLSQVARSQRPPRAWLWGWVAGGAASAQTLAPAARGGFHARTHSARPGVSGRRHGASPRAAAPSTRAPLEQAGRPSQRAARAQAAEGPSPFQSSAPGRRATSSCSHPRPLAPGAGPAAPAHRHPWQDPAARPTAWGQLPGVSGQGKKGHKAKEGAKRRQRRSRVPGPADSPGLGVGTLRGLRRLRGSRVAPRLTPGPRLPFPPLPGLLAPLSAVPFSSPQALSSPARGSVLGIKRKEGGERGGEGKGRRRKGDDPSKGGC